MNLDHEKIEQPAVSEEVRVSAAGSVQSARRRILRAGLKASPVVIATLAARPSLACHCIVPSAWGSISTGMGAQDTGDLLGANTLTGSLARFGGAIRGFSDVHHFSAYLSTGGRGWVGLREKIKANNQNQKFYPANLFADLNRPSDADQQNRRLAYLQGLYANDGKGVSVLTVSDFCSKLGFSVPVGTGSNTPLALVNSGGFGASVLIAQMNLYIFPVGMVPSSCVSKETLRNMAMLTYTPEGSGEPWKAEQVADYLHYNWIARR